MPLTREAAFEILGLPTLASVDEILLRYKTLALDWFPEKHENSDHSVENFSNISRATFQLLNPRKDVVKQLNLVEMYHFFQYVFFGGGKQENEDGEGDCCICDCDSDECNGGPHFIDEDTAREIVAEELKAAGKATQLILEEEQEKAKVERKRAKKKRRKERKKVQKAEIETNTEVHEQKKQSSELKGKTSRREVLKSSDTEEDLDPNSAFVSVIAKKHRKQIPGQQPKNIVTIPNLHNHYQPELIQENEDDPEIAILKSRQIALEGNAKANEGKYAEAVDLFSESIKLDPSDHRFYGNRSYCYDRLNLFDKALKDADKAIKLCPVWAKGYFRKGRALLGLKKYALAEKFFVEVLKRDNDCEDAISELRKAKLLQIIENGFTKEVAEAALSRHGSVSEALTSLLSSGISRIQVRDDIDIFISDDDEIENIWKPPPKPKPISQSPFYDIKRDPKNPENHNSLWIGNVQSEVTEKKLTTMFAKYGDLISVKVMPEKYCAFVNYKNKSSPGKAMEAYQGMELSGANLVIRFPNLPGEVSAPPIANKKKPGVIGQEVKKQGAVDDNECYFWRTTGCIYGEHCRYKHVKEHKGVDKKDWQVT